MYFPTYFEHGIKSLLKIENYFCALVVWIKPTLWWKMHIKIKIFSGRTPKVWVPPPPLDCSGSYFFRLFFLWWKKSVFLLRKLLFYVCLPFYSQIKKLPLTQQNNIVKKLNWIIQSSFFWYLNLKRWWTLCWFQKITLVEYLIISNFTFKNLF